MSIISIYNQLESYETIRIHTLYKSYYLNIYILNMLRQEMENNPKINGLKGQINEAHQDYEDMKRTREEAKKQLEAKFLDIYKKLEKLKESMDTESVRVNNSLKAFQNKFEYMINDLRKEIKDEADKEMKYVRDKFDYQENYLKKLEKMIIEEKEERIKQNDQQLNPIREKLVELKNENEKEKEERIKGEKDILRIIDDSVYEINEDISKVKDDSNAKQVLLKEELKLDMKNRDGYLDDFQRRIQNEILLIKDNIYLEMSNRFLHQNEIIDNISNFLKTFQDTLKVVGKE